MVTMKHDEIGHWTQMKLVIIKKYAEAYSKIMLKNPLLHHVYIDAFAGSGLHVSKSTGDLIAGSPLNALRVEPPFKEYHFIDLDRAKIDSLREIANKLKDVNIYAGDCNQILLEKVFPRVRYEDFRRGLCLLDPYGLHLHWNVIKKAASMTSIEIFLNFPLYDMNLNVLWHKPEKVTEKQRARMRAFWGDDSWQKEAYASQPGLFEPMLEKTTSHEFAEGFRKRLIDVAEFKFATKPLPMSYKNRVLYYLLFASNNATGFKIAQEIFDNYSRGKYSWLSTPL